LKPLAYCFLLLLTHEGHFVKKQLFAGISDHDGILVGQHLQPGHVHLAQIQVECVEDLPGEVRIGGVITEDNRGYIRCGRRVTLRGSLMKVWLVLMLLLLVVVHHHVGVGAGIVTHWRTARKR